jgi:hypothetical protein
LKTPKGRIEAENQEEEKKAKASERTQSLRSIQGGSKKISLSPLVSFVIVLVCVSLCIVGSYLSFDYFNQPPQPTERIPYQEALQQLQSFTATNSYLTVDETLNNEVEKCRKDDRLLESEGWNVKPTEGGFVITFSYQEKNNNHPKAVWHYDAATNTFTPQTDLAAFVYKP